MMGYVHVCYTPPYWVHGDALVITSGFTLEIILLFPDPQVCISGMYPTKVEYNYVRIYVHTYVYTAHNTYTVLKSMQYSSNSDLCVIQTQCSKYSINTWYLLCTYVLLKPLDSNLYLNSLIPDSKAKINFH